METISIMPLLILWMIFGGEKPINEPEEVISPLYAYESSERIYPFPEGKDFFDAIRGLAERMEVFPIDLWAWSGPFPSSPRTISKRYELTFNRYVPIYEFNELVCRISKQELLGGITKLDEASAREKALILNAIYLFEQIHRGKKSWNPYIELVDSQIASMSPEEWQKIFDVVKKYRDSTEVAFPAITEKDEVLKKQWESDIETSRKRYIAYGLSFKKSFYIEDYILDENTASFFQKKILELEKVDPDGGRKLAILRAYLLTFMGAAKSGIPPFEGNSSAKAKTLGDIAKQLIASRPREFDPGNVKR